VRVAIILIVIVLAVLVSALLTLRRSARTGMPPPDVLERAQRRARELEAEERKRDSE
jgi:Protein of unknown function (DUF2897)